MSAETQSIVDQFAHSMRIDELNGLVIYAKTKKELTQKKAKAIKDAKNSGTAKVIDIARKGIKATKRENYIREPFGDWMAISNPYIVSGRQVLKVKCKCGFKTTQRLSKLLEKKTDMCRSCKVKKNKEERNAKCAG